MFPLGSVLLPGSVLPLHVFEERYRRMIKDILADDDHPPEFGVVLIERGWEVGGGEQRRDIGTVARLIEVDALEGGRYAVAAVGTERLRVNAWLPDDPYPVADIDRLSDDPVDDDQVASLQETAEALLRRVRDLNALAARLGDAVPGDDIEISPDPAMAPFHLAALAPLGPVDRHRVLSADSPSERLDELENALDDVAALLEFRST